ncbi:MAG: ABC transporter ATP-binding protein, partial [Lachnospiraceae bacterium]|nr:ABC transporter ATP-binding protein [Lachnospiraceae bacterium]
MSLLEVKDLHTSFFTDAGEVKAVNGVSFFLDEGKVLGIVGESGSGKSVTAYSILQILEANGKIVSGSIKFNGQELADAGEKVMKDIRGNRISIIFQ